MLTFHFRSWTIWYRLHIPLSSLETVWIPANLLQVLTFNQTGFQISFLKVWVVPEYNPFDKGMGMATQLGLINAPNSNISETKPKLRSDRTLLFIYLVCQPRADCWISGCPRQGMSLRLRCRFRNRWCCQRHGSRSSCRLKPQPRRSWPGSLHN